MKQYIKTVTVTGASDDTEFDDMIKIQQEFPFVEWGILYSNRVAGKNKRFPSNDWLRELDKFNETSNQLNLSVHLCGEAVNKVLTNFYLDNNVCGNLNCSLKDDLGCRSIFNFIFQISGLNRVQINTHGEKHEYDIRVIEKYIAFSPHIQFIAQYDNVNNYIHELNDLGYSNISALYDLSHGAGVLPDSWSKPLNDIFTGYAGGLSVDNLEEQLSKLDSLIDTPIWIDAETWLRTEDNFDLNKVVRFLEIAKTRVIK